MKKAQFPVRKLRPHNVVLSARWQKASHFEWDSLNGVLYPSAGEGLPAGL